MKGTLRARPHPANIHHVTGESLRGSVPRKHLGKFIHSFSIQKHLQLCSKGRPRVHFTLAADLGSAIHLVCFLMYGRCMIKEVMGSSFTVSESCCISQGSLEEQTDQMNLYYINRRQYVWLVQQHLYPEEKSRIL